MRIDIVTLFPELCQSFLGASILGRAADKGLFEAHCHQIRDYTTNKQKQTDDYPYGGGCGMVLYAQPIADCLRDVIRQCEAQGRPRPHIVFMTAGGQPYNQQIAKRLAQCDSLTLVCGHYEGIDERFIEECVDEEISLGDFVMTGGEIPAMAVADAVCRMVPGVLPDAECFEEESHWNGLLEYPQYTRPEVWEGRPVPPVLLTGDHGKITTWRSRQAHARTAARRPDLYKDWCLRHPLHPRRWKRNERAELIRTDAALDAAAQVYAASWQAMCAPVCTAEYVAQHTPQTMRAELQADRAAGWAFYLHSTAGVPDALIGVCHKTGEIGRLYVRPESQGQGIGALLLEFARKKLSEHAAPHLFVLDVNLPALALYLRMGYRFDSVAKVYDPAENPAAVQFCRELKFIYAPRKTEEEKSEN